MSEPVVTKTYFITDKEDNEFPEAFVNSTNPRSIEVQCCHFTYNHNTSLRPHWTMHCSFVQSDPYLDKATITTNETRTKFKTYPYKGCQDTFKIWFSGDDIDKEPEKYVLKDPKVQYIDMRHVKWFVDDSPTYRIIISLLRYEYDKPFDGMDILTQQEIQEIRARYNQALAECPNHQKVLAVLKPLIDRLVVGLTKKSGNWILYLLNDLLDFPDWQYSDALAQIMTDDKAFGLIKAKGNDQFNRLKEHLLIFWIQYPTLTYNALLYQLSTIGVDTTNPQQTIYRSFLNIIFPEHNIRTDLTMEAFLEYFPVIAVLDEILNEPGDTLLDQLEFYMMQNDMPLPAFATSCKLFYPIFMSILADSTDPNRVPTVTPRIKISDQVIGTVRREIYQWTYTDPAIGVFEVTQQENYYDPNLIPHKFLAEFMLIY